MTAFVRLSHVGVVSADAEQSVEWYCSHLGFERLYDYSFPGVRAYFIRQGDFRVEFFQSEGSTEMDAGRRSVMTNIKIGGINHFALEVADLDATITSLRDKGVEVVQDPSEIPGSSGERFAFIRDNMGMLVELLQPNRTS